jgi:hypothetical protein
VRVLAFPILTPSERQVGLISALERLADGDGFELFDWIPFFCAEKIHALRREFRKVVQRFQPDFSFLQIQTQGILMQDDLAAIPGFKLAWTGDIRRPMPEHYAYTAAHVDCSCFACDEDVKSIRDLGFTADYLGIGFSPTIYFPQETAQTNPQIVFLGNNYRENTFPLSLERREMVMRLKQIHGDNFQAYGRNWEGSWLVDTKEEEVEIYRRCRIAINQNHFGGLSRWSSDRLLRAMGCGAFMLSNYYKGIEKDFEIGKHLDVWQTLPELEKKIDYYLATKINVQRSQKLDASMFIKHLG